MDEVDDGDERDGVNEDEDDDVNDSSSLNIEDESGSGYEDVGRSYLIELNIKLNKN
jgi:hypothetical protein